MASIKAFRRYDPNIIPPNTCGGHPALTQGMMGPHLSPQTDSEISADITDREALLGINMTSYTWVLMVSVVVQEAVDINTRKLRLNHMPSLHIILSNMALHNRNTVHNHQVPLLARSALLLISHMYLRHINLAAIHISRTMEGDLKQPHHKPIRQ